MGAKFLCCLPLRLGVLVIACLQFIVSIAVAGLMWWAFYHRDQVDGFTTRMKVSLILYGVVYSITAIISLVGFLGAIFRKFGFIRTFASVLAYALGFQIGATVFFLILFFVDKDAYINRCIGSSTDQTVIDMCNSYTKVSKPALIVSAIIPILIQAYAVYVVSAYAKRLQREKVDHSIKTATYQPVQGSESYPLTHPPTNYPYADATHSFGHKEGYKEGSHV